MEFPNFGKPHESQRGYFAASLYEAMIVNKNIWILVGDLGYGMLDRHKQDFPDRFVNTGAAEASMMGLAVGLALEGRVPFTYTITSFYLRAAETIGLYLHGEQIPVQLIGSGRDDDYKHDGPSHHGGLVQSFLSDGPHGFLNIKNYYPQTKEELPTIVNDMLISGKPGFLSLRR